MPKLFPLALLLSATSGFAQQPISTARVAVTQNFDSLGSSASAALPTGWRHGEVWTAGSSALTEAAGTSGTGVITEGAVGGAYNWANGVTGTATDRAPGFLSAAGFLGIGYWPSPSYMGYAFINQTGETIRALDLSWSYEKYRSGTRAFNWSFSHGTVATSLTADPAGAQSYAADADKAVVNPSSSVAKSFRLSGLSIAPGSTYYLRWAYTGTGGSSNAQGLAIDDFSITPIAPNLATPAALGAFTAEYANASPPQTLIVDGAELTGPVTVTAPAGYEVSSDAVSYSTSLSLAAASLPATISVRMAAVSASYEIGSVSGNLVLASPDAVTRTVSLTGTRTGVVTASFSSAADIPVTASSLNPTGSTLDISLNFAPVSGTILTVVRNTGLPFINGEFNNLAQGQELSLSFAGRTYYFVANYYGGTGNDLELVWRHNRPMAWGNNSSGELGNNSSTKSFVPVAVNRSGILQGKTVTAIAAGTYHNLALCSDGTLAAWGYNGDGQVGDGSGLAYRRVPVAVEQGGVLAGKRVVSIAAGRSHSIALCSDGTVVAWGANDDGRLGDGTQISRAVPVAVNTSGGLSGKTVVSISAGDYHNFALCSDGALVAWGRNSSGQLGDGTQVNRPVPVGVSASGVLSGKTVVDVAGGAYTSVALCSDGTIAQWGYSTFIPQALSSPGALAGKTVVDVEAGDSQQLALCADGTVAAWGYNAYGQLGDGTTTTRSEPVAVNTSGVLSGKTVTAIAAGSHHNMVACSDGTLATFGYNTLGQLGNDSTSNSDVPVAVSARGPMVAGKSAISGGFFHSVALAPLFENADLSNLTLSSGALNLVFDSSTTSYTATVANAIESITLTPTLVDGTATVTVNGTSVTSGSASSSVPLAVGDNTITTVVTAEDGITTKTYTVVVTREVSIIFDNTAGKTTALDYHGNGISSTLAFGYRILTGNKGFDLSSITLALSDFEAATALQIRLFAVGGDFLPSGPALATQNYASRSFGNTPAYFTFPLNGFSLRANTSYILFVGASSGGASWKRYEPNIEPQSSAGWTVGSMLLEYSGTYYDMPNSSDRWAIQLTGTPAAPPAHTHQEEWRFANFGSYDSVASGADSADPDGDGLNNLLEYALGTAPNSSGVMPAALVLNGANLEYTYTRSTAAKDNGVTYQIEWSETLEAGSWSTETVSQQITSTEGALETVKTSVPAGAGGKRFLRLRVGAPVGGQ